MQVCEKFLNIKLIINVFYYRNYRLPTTELKIMKYIRSTFWRKWKHQLEILGNELNCRSLHLMEKVTRLSQNMHLNDQKEKKNLYEQKCVLLQINLAFDVCDLYIYEFNNIYHSVEIFNKEEMLRIFPMQYILLG